MNGIIKWSILSRTGIDKGKGPHTMNTILYSHLTSKADQTKTWITEEQATQQSNTT